MTKKQHASAIQSSGFSLPLRDSKLCPVELLQLDFDNPRLQTGSTFDIRDERGVIEALVEIAALDELITSICTNKYLNLEPLIVFSELPRGPFTVLEGNRRLAAIKLISSPDLARELGVTIPKNVASDVYRSFENVLVHRVNDREDSREFIGFKHINGPQRWDAFAKARYVTDWYKSEYGKANAITIDQIAAKMGDNNNTMRAYIYAVLILDQASDSRTWSLAEDRPKTRGRFAFSHLYTAIGRDEFQTTLGLTGPWSSKPSLHPVAKKHLPDLKEVLMYLYGSVPDDRTSLIKSQNPDLKDIGLALVRPEARAILRNRGDLDAARDASKDAATAFQDALIAANLKLARAIDLLPRYDGGDNQIDTLVGHVFEQADTLQTMVTKKTKRKT